MPGHVPFELEPRIYHYTELPSAKELAKLQRMRNVSVGIGTEDLATFNKNVFSAKETNLAKVRGFNETTGRGEAMRFLTHNKVRSSILLVGLATEVWALYEDVEADFATPHDSRSFKNTSIGLTTLGASVGMQAVFFVPHQITAAALVGLGPVGVAVTTAAAAALVIGGITYGIRELMSLLWDVIEGRVRQGSQLSQDDPRLWEYCGVLNMTADELEVRNSETK